MHHVGAQRAAVDENHVTAAGRPKHVAHQVAQVGLAGAHAAAAGAFSLKLRGWLLLAGCRGGWLLYMLYGEVDTPESLKTILWQGCRPVMDTGVA